MCRQQRGYWVKALFVLALLGVVLGISPHSWAESSAVDPEAYCTVTYEVNAFEVDTLKPTKVIGVTTIGSQAFLIVDVGGPQKALGYVELDRVRAILPTQGVFSVERKHEPGHEPVILPDAPP